MNWKFDESLILMNRDLTDFHSTVACQSFKLEILVQGLPYVQLLLRLILTIQKDIFVLILATLKTASQQT